MRAKSLRPRDRPILGSDALTRVRVDHSVRKVQLYAIVTKTTISKVSFFINVIILKRQGNYHRWSYSIFHHSMRKVPTVRPAVQAQSSYFTLTMTKKVYAPRE